MNEHKAVPVVLLKVFVDDHGYGQVKGSMRSLSDDPNALQMLPYGHKLRDVGIDAQCGFIGNSKQWYGFEVGVGTSSRMVTLESVRKAMPVLRAIESRRTRQGEDYRTPGQMTGLVVDAAIATGAKHVAVEFQGVRQSFKIPAESTDLVLYMVDILARTLEASRT